MSAFALASLALAHVLATAAAVDSPWLDDDARARVEANVAEGLALSPSIEVVRASGAVTDLRCAREPACLTRAADAHQARYVVFAQAGRSGPLFYLILDGYDARRGAYAGRESIHMGSEDDLARATPLATAAVLERLALSDASLLDRMDAPGANTRADDARAVGAPRTRVLFLGVLAPPKSDEDRSVFAGVPPIVYGAALLVAVGSVFHATALGLVLWAAERDQAAAATALQFDAYVIQNQRNLLVAFALMSAAAGLGFYTFAGMGAAYGVLEEL